jgi:hypothetical protein
MDELKLKQITHDQRKIFPQIYGLKPGPVVIEKLPEINYVSQEMLTTFALDNIANPQPIDEPWIA